MWYFKWVILSAILALLVAGVFSFLLRLVLSGFENITGRALLALGGGRESDILTGLFFFFWLLFFLLFKRLFHDAQ